MFRVELVRVKWTSPGDLPRTYILVNDQDKFDNEFVFSHINEVIRKGTHEIASIENVDHKNLNIVDLC